MVNSTLISEEINNITIAAFVFGQYKVIATQEEYIDLGLHPLSIYFSHVDITLDRPHAKVIILYHNEIFPRVTVIHVQKSKMSYTRDI